MSLASRQPFDGYVASFPVLVDRRTGRILRDVIRAELQSHDASRPAAWSKARLLAVLFQKVRVQLRAAHSEMERDAETQVRRAAERAALEVEARAIAKRHGFDPNTLSHLRNRWAYGSLADTWPAAGMRAKYSRAIEIATARQMPALQAAE